jgi:UDP-GlcNAc:undecaprenyl-phosphate/decaprenyl-phosphate GlcNAc-1-phosphate transferase
VRSRLDYPFVSVEAVVVVTALPLTFAVLWALLRTSIDSRLVAVPSGQRWHSRETPTFGGIGMFAGFAGGVLAALATGAIDWSGELGGILGGVALVFIAGLVDDVWHLNVLAKLGAQIAAAVIVLASGLEVQVVGNEVIASGIGLLWLVGITNAFNLLDNMDGLAATLAAIACGYFAIDALTQHQNDTVLVLSLALGVAALAFLPFNLRPGRAASVFMGDSGSQVLGFGLASLALASSWTVAGTTFATVLLPLLILAVPILDTTLVTIVRVAQRRPVTVGGRDHSSHRLVYYGLSEAKAVLLLALVAAAVGATALAYNVLDNARLTVVGVLLTFVLLVQFGSFLSDLEERSRAGQEAPQPSLWRALVFEPRRLLEVVVDFVVICGSFLAAYVLVVGLPLDTPDPARIALRAVRRSRRLPPYLALRDRARRRPHRGGVRRVGGGRVRARDRPAPDRLLPRLRGARRRRRPLHRPRRRVAAHAPSAPGGARAAESATARARRRRRTSGARTGPRAP